LDSTLGKSFTTRQILSLSLSMSSGAVVVRETADIELAESDNKI
jgi:hypothetical protein